MNKIIRPLLTRPLDRQRLVAASLSTYGPSDDNEKSIAPKSANDKPKRINAKDGLASIKESLVVKDVDNILVDWYAKRPPPLPKRCDVVIIGGGAMGSSIAYWLRKRLYSEDFTVVVVERDPMVIFLFFSIRGRRRCYRWAASGSSSP